VERSLVDHACDLEPSQFLVAVAAVAVTSWTPRAATRHRPRFGRSRGQP